MLNAQLNKTTTGLYFYQEPWKPPKQFFPKNLIVEKAINVERSV